MACTTGLIMAATVLTTETPWLSVADIVAVGTMVDTISMAAATVGADPDASLRRVVQALTAAVPAQLASTAVVRVLLVSTVGERVAVEAADGVEVLPCHDITSTMGDTVLNRVHRVLVERITARSRIVRD